MRFPARILSFFLTLVLLGSILTPFANAQTNDTLSQLMPSDSSVQMNIATLTQGVFLGMLSSVTCVLGGVDFTSPTHTCLTYNNQTHKYSYAPTIDGGLLGLGATGIALTFNNPVHMSDYFTYLSQNFGFVKTAHAANGPGIGFDQLSPITNLWLAFRNMAYLFFVIIFVVVGFAVMLRAKIDPRTVMTIENQIPKLIVALILITFSFAIAGFVIDVMWVGIYLVINLGAALDPQVLGKQVAVITTTVKDNPYNWVSSLNSGPAGFIGIAQQAAGAVKDIADAIAFNVFQNAGFLKVFLTSIFGIPLILSCAAAGIFHINISLPFGQSLQTGQDFGACLDAGMATLVSSIIGAVAFIIFAVAMLVAIAKLWWSLIKAYTLFLIFTIFGPLIILSGVIPGWTKTNFEYWLRHVLAYAIVFPTAMGVFLLGKTLMDVYQTQTTGVPPLLGVDGKVLSFVGPLLGFAIIMLAPQSLAMVQDALNAPDPKYLASIGQAIAGGAQPFTSAGGNVFKRWTREADMFHEEGALRRAFLGEQRPNNWWRRFWVGSERNGFGKP